jgi:hypothetical protein
MEGTHHVRRHGRITPQKGEGIPGASTEMRELPPWESFPLEDRHRLVQTILQAARHQVETRSTSSHPGR